MIFSQNRFYLKNSATNLLYFEILRDADGAKMHFEIKENILYCYFQNSGLKTTFLDHFLEIPQNNSQSATLFISSNIVCNGYEKVKTKNWLKL